MLIPLLILLFSAAYCDQNLCDQCKCTSTDNAQILSIDCKDQNLEDTPIAWPPQNATTIRASFVGNNITTIQRLPDTNATLELVFSKCNVLHLNPGMFVGTKNVIFLDLSHNGLTNEEVTADRFKGPSNQTVYQPIMLEHLNLSYNLIHSLGKNVFKYMPNLKHLDLEGNDFKVLDAPTQVALSSLGNLQSLNLANNELTELVRDAIKNQSCLTQINLAMNELDFVPEVLAQVGGTLEVLILDDNPILELSAESFMGLENIKELSLNNLPKVRYVNANTFVPTKKLKKLSLSNNILLRDIDREAFAINQTLEELYLNNNILENIDFKLLQWSSLRVFELYENPLDCSCDLYNITLALSKDITKNKNSPYCTDPMTNTPVPIFGLQSDICSVKFKGKSKAQMEYIQYHFSLVRTALIVLSVILMLVAFTAAVLGYIRYRRYQRNLTYPYASQVSYNPLTTNAKF